MRFRKHWTWLSSLAGATIINEVYICGDLEYFMRAKSIIRPKSNLHSSLLRPKSVDALQRPQSEDNIPSSHKGLTNAHYKQFIPEKKIAKYMNELRGHPHPLLCFGMMLFSCLPFCNGSTILGCFPVIMTYIQKKKTKIWSAVACVFLEKVFGLQFKGNTIWRGKKDTKKTVRTVLTKARVQRWSGYEVSKWRNSVVWSCVSLRPLCVGV